MESYFRMHFFFEIRTRSADNVSVAFSRPKGKQMISPSDRETILSGGLAVVECSWARIDDVPFHKIASPHERLRGFLSVHRVVYSFSPLSRSTLPHCYKSDELRQALAT